MIHGGAGVRAMTRAQRTTLSRVLVYGWTLLKEGYDSCFVVKAAQNCRIDLPQGFSGGLYENGQTIVRNCCQVFSG